MEGTQFNVAFGYLTVLLSTISLHAEARARMVAKLPGRSFQPLKDVAVEFLRYHQQVNSQQQQFEGGGVAAGAAGGGAVGGGGGGGRRGDDEFTKKLQEVVKRLVDG